MQFRSALLLLILILSLSLSFAVEQNNPLFYEQEKGEPNSLTGFIYDYAIPLALVVSYTLIALGFMVSKIFSSREMEIWSRVELREAFISTLYAGLIVSLVPVFNVLVNSFAGTEDYMHLFSTVINTSFRKLMDYSLYVATITFLNGISWSPTAFFTLFGIYNTSFSIYFTPQSVYSLVMTFSMTFVPILLGGIISILGQYTLLLFLEKSLYVFLGLGLLLRAFTFTRRMGSTLIGIFLGGFIFLKFALVIEAAIYGNLVASGQFTEASNEKILDITTPNLIQPIAHLFDLLILPKYLVQFCLWLNDEVACWHYGPWAGMCYAFVWSSCWIIGQIVWVFDVILTAINLFVALFQTAAMVLELIILGPGKIGMDIADKIATQIAVSSDELVIAYFFPIFNIIFTLIGITAFVQALGGDETVVNMLTFL